MLHMVIAMEEAGHYASRPITYLPDYEVFISLSMFLPYVLY